MSLFNELFNSNIKKWNMALSDDNIPYEFKTIIKNFFIKDGIDFEKYLENEKANNLVDSFFGGAEDWEIANSLSIYPDVRNLKINCTPTFKEHFANSRGDRNPFLPYWYYIAYPDVARWMHKNFDLIKSECNEKESEFFTEDGPMPIFYRVMIDTFKNKTGKRLECS